MGSSRLAHDLLTTAPHPRPLAGIEGRLPPQIAEKAESDGIAKASQDAVTLLSLGVFGGAFISFGAIFATVALTGAEGALPFGIARVVAGLVFGVGLGLVKDAAGVAFWNMIGATGTMFPDLTLRGFAANLTTVTIGNVVGGAVLVSGAYWLLYRRFSYRKQLTYFTLRTTQTRGR